MKPVIHDIALVAHDNKKVELLEWAGYNTSRLAPHRLYATGTTGTMLEYELGLTVHRFLSGPVGGRPADRRSYRRGLDRHADLLLGPAGAAAARS